MEYWPETGSSGFRVWKFRLRRDDSVSLYIHVHMHLDRISSSLTQHTHLTRMWLLCLQSPAPWEKEGQKMAKKLNLTMQYPEGYLESKQAAASSLNDSSNSKGKSRKRKSS